MTTVKEQLDLLSSGQKVYRKSWRSIKYISLGPDGNFYNENGDKYVGDITINLGDPFIVYVEYIPVHWTAAPTAFIVLGNKVEWEYKYNLFADFKWRPWDGSWATSKTDFRYKVKD